MCHSETIIVQEAPISNQAPSSDALALERLADVAQLLGEDSITVEVRQLASRVNEGRFFVACVRQFKRGKSTLLNALVGEPVLPTGIVPVTALPTVLRYGNARSARVLIDGRWRKIQTEHLSMYVSEELNPENSKQVAGVEVFLPSPLLASGMCLVDTPGVGSVFTGNTETTETFIPQVDAAILVVGADPPISGDELALIEAVSVNVDQILVVLNKIDRVSVEERQQASSFASKVLEERLKRAVNSVYEVSALKRLSDLGDSDDWERLVQDLSRLAGESGYSMTHSAAERGLHRFSASLGRCIDERIRALTEPIALSEQRILSLRETVSEAEQSLRDLGVLFSAEQMRLSNILLSRRKAFLKEVFPTAKGELKREAESGVPSFGPKRRRSLMALAQAVARRNVMPWLDAEEAHSEELYVSITQRFVNLTNDLLRRISEEETGDFSHLPKAFDPEHGFRTRSRFFFHDMVTLAQPPSPLLYVADVVMGVLRIHWWFERDATQFLELLLDTNA
ncbi:MAG TPA: dynamin family protein [Terriglobales bacterium]|nr:dynamin family protein [Terriglobales bacterium]